MTYHNVITGIGGWEQGFIWIMVGKRPNYIKWNSLTTLKSFCPIQFWIHTFKYPPNPFFFLLHGQRVVENKDVITAGLRVPYYLKLNWSDLGQCLKTVRDIQTITSWSQLLFDGTLLSKAQITSVQAEYCNKSYNQ